MELVCRLLEVSRSGYYEWLGRKPSLRRQKDQELKRRLLSLHQRYPALGMAVRRRKPLPGLIFHSDRGVQYAAYAYRQRLASLGIRQSMSRKGDPYDNAVAENFFSCLKCECVHLRHFASRAHAMADVFAYIETFYNPVRPHSSIGWRPPDAFARALSEHPAA